LVLLLLGVGLQQVTVVGWLPPVFQGQKVINMYFSTQILAFYKG
jgi:hypothetical protein